MAACLSHNKAELTRRMKPCPPQEPSARQLPFHDTRLSPLVALFHPESPDSSSGNARPCLFSSFQVTVTAYTHCGSTSTMGTSMVDEYPTLFRDSFLFGLYSIPSLTLLRL